MIKKISIEGYKSIKELKDFELKPLNVLIGPNKGGKSNFLDFFALINHGVKEPLSEGIRDRGGIYSLFWAGGAKEIRSKLNISATGYNPTMFPDAIIDIEYDLSIVQQPRYNKSADYYLREYFNGKDMREKEEPLEDSFIADPSLSVTELALQQKPESIHYPLLGELLRISHYSWFNTNQGSPMRNAQVLQPGTSPLSTRLSPQGDNLSNVYYHLFNTAQHRQYKNEITEILRDVFKEFDDILFPADLSPNNVLLRWADKPFKRAFWPFELSDGTLRFLCLLAILYNPYPPTLVCIDEPTIGLHPELVKYVAGLLKLASDRTQLIITTHSPPLISSLNPEDIVVVESENGASKYIRKDPDELEHWLKDFTLGELWELGEIGGRM